MPTNRSILYVDFGYSTAREMWEEVGIPTYNKFVGDQNRATAMEAAIHAWHIHEWAWHEDNPGTDSQRDPAYRIFRDSLISDCPELGWARDIADAAKHRGLGRPVDVQRVNAAVGGGVLAIGGKVILVGGKAVMLPRAGLSIELTDGTQHAIADVLARVVAFWQSYFEGRDNRAESGA